MARGRSASDNSRGARVSRRRRAPPGPDTPAPGRGRSASDNSRGARVSRRRRAPPGPDTPAPGRGRSASAAPRYDPRVPDAFDTGPGPSRTAFLLAYAAVIVGGLFG